MKSHTWRETGKVFMNLSTVSIGTGILFPLFKKELTIEGTLTALISGVVFLIVGIILLERSEDG